MDKKQKVLLASTIVKYIFALVLTGIAAKRVGNMHFLAAGILELFFIVFLSNIAAKGKVTGQIINSVLMFFYNAQMMVLMFGNSYITMVMLTNVASIESLAGKAVLYIGGAILAVLFSLLPIWSFKWKIRYDFIGILMLAALEFVFVLGAGNEFSPMYGYARIAMQHHEKQKSLRAISDALANTEMSIVDSEFLHSDIKDYIAKPEVLEEKPNVILIFTEGLSKHIIDDERMIMPNVARLQEESICFTSYYNHTFATYRGLLGQLYSGYQLADFDANELVSIQSILSDQGYQTAFINPEPCNLEFTAYLESFDFDRTLGDITMELRSLDLGLADKDAYELLYNTAEEMADQEAPFFVSIYTYGTHTSFDAIDEKFEDGTEPVLNRFYDVDYQFGVFWEKIRSNPKFDNTIIIYTADHATYQDADFDSAFPEYERVFQCMDEIPCMIYHKGVEPKMIDVGGRNSLNLVPTILDYMDVSAPNYFMGTSLFSGKTGSFLETSYCDSYTNYSSSADMIRAMGPEDAAEVNDTIRNYYITRELAAKQKEEESVQ